MNNTPKKIITKNRGKDLMDTELDKIEKFVNQAQEKYTNSSANIMLHDTLKLKKTEPIIDLTITSPPYNLDIDYGSSDDKLEYDHYLKFTRKWLTKTYQLSKDTARLCLNIPLDKNKNGIQSVYSDLVQEAKKSGWKYFSTIIWNEGNISRRTAWGSWMSASAPYTIAPVETIVVFYKNNWKKKNKGTSTITRDEFLQYTNGLWTFNGESKKRIGHPAPYPLELPERCIKLFSYQEDTVFDPFSGSGTTICAAIKNSRAAIGVEKDKQYYENSIKRIEKIKKT